MLRRMVVLLPTLALLALTATLSAPHADAQTVHGKLVREHDGQPLPGGWVYLLTPDGASVDSTRAAADGAFTVHAPRPGSYQLYFKSPGYASVPSDLFRLAAGQSAERRFAVPLISGVAMRRMGEVIHLEKRLQGDITELCGERPRSWEAGLLVGTVRAGDTKKPVAGAVVTVDAPAKAGGVPFHKSTVTSANGVYVICNVPAGSAQMRTEAGGYHTDSGPVEARAGDVGWYDIELRPDG